MSLTAAILKWLEFTPEVAVLVVSCDGFIDWASSSKPALRKGAFFRTRNRPPIPVPEGSLAAQPSGCFSPDRMDHACGVWFAGFAATEFAVISERYDMTLSLLLLGRARRDSQGKQSDSLGSGAAARGVWGGARAK